METEKKSTKEVQTKARAKAKLSTYLRLPIYLTVFWLAMAGVLASVSSRAAWIVLGASFAYFITTFIIYLVRQHYVMKDYVEFAMDYSQVQRNLIKELAIPYGVMDSDGMMLWCNDEFAKVSGREKSGFYIRDMFPNIKAFALPKHDMEDRTYKTEINGHYYDVLFRMMETPEFDEELKALRLNDKKGKTQKVVAIYLYDTTELVNLKQENFDRRMVMGLLYIDNYEEVLESLDEVKRSLILALVDRKINKYMQDIDAVIKKLEKDKYLFVFQNRYMSDLSANRFSLLEDVRSVNMTTSAEASITISMGIGVNADSYIGGYEAARAAIDLALGRGGDQAVVKDGDNITYYGGKSESVEKNTRVKARVKAGALRECIEGHEQVFIMGHSNGDADCFGAAVGIYAVCRHLNKKAYIIVNEIGSGIQPVISRFLNNTDYPDDMFVSNMRAQDLAQPSALLIVVDVNRPAYTECPELFDLIDHVIVLDHHRMAGDSIANAELSYVEPYVSSACELVAEIIQYIGDNMRLRPIEADAMYAGVMVDTNNFLAKTGVRTFEAAAFLRRSGADITRVRKAFRSDMMEYRAKARAVAGLEMWLDSYAMVEIEADGLDSPTIIAAQVANDLLEIVGVKASFAFTEYRDKIFISARSIDEVNVQVIMEKVGGGGHMTVAGAQMTGVTVAEAMKKMKSVLNAMKQEGELS